MRIRIAYKPANDAPIQVVWKSNATDAQWQFIAAAVGSDPESVLFVKQVDVRFGGPTQDMSLRAGSIVGIARID